MVYSRSVILHGSRTYVGSPAVDVSAETRVLECERDRVTSRIGSCSIFLFPKLPLKCEKIPLDTPKVLKDPLQQVKGLKAASFSLDLHPCRVWGP